MLPSRSFGRSVRKEELADDRYDRRCEIQRAIIYSIAETVKANHLNPFRYFELLLTEIPRHMDDTDRTFLKELEPWSLDLPVECRKQLN